MATVGDDCYFFCTSTCSKGDACPFRHVEAAKSNKIICQHWQTVGCLRPMCRYRHSDFHIQVNYSEVPCYWESQPNGCHKPACPYKHSKPRTESKQSDAEPVKPASPVQTVSDPESSKAVDAFVMPTVKPVIIDPESEASNSSPVKRQRQKSIDTEPQENQLDEDDSEPIKKKKATGTTNSKKTVKVVKKKSGIVTKKAVKVSDKKRLKEDLPVSSKKVAVKRKSSESVKRAAKVPPKKPVKDRLGVTRPANSNPKQEEESTSDDSDDSIENVKVLSMEEIFRQKALESMMKKRASEGKPMLPRIYSGPKKPTIAPQKPRPTPSGDNKRKLKPAVIRKKTPTPPPTPSESETEEEEEEEEEEKETEEEDVTASEDDKEEEHSEAASSDANDTSSNESESEEEVEGRRVVINLDAEKSARKRAQASLVRKESVAKKLPKTKTVREKPRSLLSLRMSSPSRLSAKERLGKLPTNRAVPTVSSRVNLVKSSSEEEVSDDDIEAQQLQKGNRSNNSNRQVLVSEDIEPPNKTRLWSSVSPKSSSSRVVESATDDVEDDERTICAVTPEALAHNDSVAESADEPESPFEALRRKALLKKRLQLKEELFRIKDESDDAGGVGEQHDLNNEDEAVEKGKKKKHKKHKHKHHKKSKKERQIYVPPSKKLSDTQGVSNELEASGNNNKRVVSPSHIMLSTSTSSMVLKPSDEISEYQEQPPRTSPPLPPSQSQPRSRPKAASLWTAGLSVSAKGTVGRRPPPQQINTTTVPNKLTDNVSIASRLGKNGSLSSSSMSSLSLSSGEIPVVKTFSQIMAEKRQKRLQGKGDSNEVISIKSTNSSSSSPSRPLSMSEDSKPRIPITPIRFNMDKLKEQNPSSSRLKPAPIASSTQSSTPLSPLKKRTLAHQSHKSLPLFTSSSSVPSMSKKSTIDTLPASDLRPTYKKERAKKLFKKTTSRSNLEAEVLEVDSQKFTSSAHHQSPSPLHQSTKASDDTNIRPLSSSRDVPTDDEILKTSPNVSVAKERRISSSSDSKTTKSQLSLLDDEFAFFEDDDVERLGDILDKDMEPIDDLLQDIEDLLA